MNRNEEYIDLMNELDEQAPSMESSIAKAKKRKLRKQMLWRPMATVAVMCAMFVLLVNVSEPVAQAVSKVPLIGELAEKLKFSNSLSDAVKNDHIQMINQKQTVNGITAEVVYMIADVKQVNILYRVTSDTSKDLCVVTHFDNRTSGGGAGGIGKSDGELYMNEYDFNKGTPDSIEFRLEIYNSKEKFFEREESIATFEFDLEVDKELMGEAKIYNIDKTLEAGGQTITVKAIEVYPTHAEVVVIPENRNIARLGGGMKFYINTDKGTKFEKVMKGTVMQSSNDEFAFFVDSMYFYDEKPVELVITDVEWWVVEARRPFINLDTGECKYLPDGIEFVSLERKDNAWSVSFKAKLGENWSEYQLFSGGVTYKNNSGKFDERVTTDCGDGYFIETLTIYDWPYGELMLQPNIEYTWTPTEEIVIPLQ